MIETKEFEIGEVHHESFLDEIIRITKESIYVNQQKILEEIIEMIKNRIKDAAELGQNKIKFQLSGGTEVNMKDLIVKKIQELGFICEYKYKEADLREPMSCNSNYIIVEWHL